MNLIYIYLLIDKLLYKLLPEGNFMPNIIIQARGFVISLGMDSIVFVHVIMILFYFEGLLKMSKHFQVWLIMLQGGYKDANIQATKVPNKVLQTFPIIPSIHQQMFRSKSIARLMTWHTTHCLSDGMMRVPANSFAWQHIEEKWPVFKEEP